MSSLPLELVNSRVARIPGELRQRLLDRAGAHQDEGEADEGCRCAPGWGFPTNLPPRQRLIDYLEQQQQAAKEHAAVEAAQQRDAAGQQARASQPAAAQAQQAQHPAAQQAQQRPILLELLQQSRTFQSPDCADAMAEALGVADLHRGLRGSLLYDAPPEAAVHAVRGKLRGALRSAWSQEALKRGVALAKASDLPGATACYDQALQLDPGNADALVARGAAHANTRQWQRASDDLEAALQLQPAHSNARQYLDAVQAKAAAEGVQLAAWAGANKQLAFCQHNGGEQQQQQPPPPPEQQQQQQNACDSDHEELRQRPELGVQDHGNTTLPDQRMQRCPPEESADREGGRKRRRGSRSSSRSRSRGRGASRSRSRSRSRGRQRRGSRDRSRSSSGTSSSSGGSSSSDEEAEAAAARLAAAQQRLQEPGGSAADGAGGMDGMDVATALQIVASHYKSRQSKRKGKDRDKGKAQRRRKDGKHKHRRKKKHKRHRR